MHYTTIQVLLKHIDPNILSYEVATVLIGLNSDEKIAQTLDDMIIVVKS